jgi:hypothetical protein
MLQSSAPSVNITAIIIIIIITISSSNSSKGWASINSCYLGVARDGQSWTF